MAEFVKGARVKQPAERELNLVEASFVTCSIAKREGIGELRQFLAYMERAWMAYQRAAVLDNGRQE